MKFNVKCSFPNLMILERKTADGWYEYYMSNPWLTVIEHWVGQKDKISVRDIREHYEIGTYDRFIRTNCY